MTHDPKTILNPKDARNAGALYLTIAVCGGFSIGSTGDCGAQI